MATRSEAMKTTAQPVAMSSLARLKTVIVSTTGEQRVWALTAVVVGFAGLVGLLVSDFETVALGQRIPLWVLAPLFYLGEITVVHVRFKRNTQSFSMSEIPLVLGLFFASPLLLLASQLVGNAAALLLNRKQPALKLIFNLAQFTLVTAVSVGLFRGLLGGADPFGSIGWLAAIGAVAVGNVAANGLVHIAIRATGGRLTRGQIGEVLLLSTMAAAVNTSLALLAVTLFEMRPAASWLALLPLVVLYGAYRAYVGQKHERSRLETLYEITKVLHASPQIDTAIAAAAQNAQSMFEAERVDVLLLNHEDMGWVYQTTVDSGGPVRVMSRVLLPPEDELTSWLERLNEAMVLTSPPPLPDSTFRGEEMVVAPLTAETGVIGAVIVADPLSDVSGFGEPDVKLLDAIAGKISVSLRNGRLEDSLNELTGLKERLEEQVRGKDQFIATVSHELRTPLTTVLGLSHELGERRGDFSEDELDEIVALIANESTELSHLIEDLLVGARADVSTLSLHPQFISLEEELSLVAQGHAHQMSSDPVSIRWSSRREKVWADPLRLRQIVRNLLSNAARYGGDEVWLDVDDQGSQVVVTVVDTGSGVARHLRERIFEAYESGHDKGERAQPGSVGLGLAVSRRLAELMGGSLEYHQVDGNTGFKLALPAYPRDSKAGN